MMFDEQTLDMILKGKKTQTRRLRNDDNRPAVPGNIHKLKIDRTSKTYGYIEIISCEKAVFGDITEADAHKEGFKNVKEYTEYFVSVNGEVKKSTPIWVINFKLVNVKTKYFIQVIKNYVSHLIRPDEITKSYSHAPHLQVISGNLSTTDPKILQQRYDDLKNAISTSREYFTTKQGKPKAKKEEWRRKELLKIDKEIMKNFRKSDKKITDEVNLVLDDIEKEFTNLKEVTFLGDRIIFPENNPYKEFSRKWDIYKKYKTNFKRINEIREDIEFLENDERLGGKAGDSWKTFAYGTIKSDMSWLNTFNTKHADFPEQGTFIDMPEKFYELESTIDDIYQENRYKCDSVQKTYDKLRAEEDIKLRDYEYEMYRLKKHCKNNNIELEL